MEIVRIGGRGERMEDGRWEREDGSKKREEKREERREK
jgi:hypothetical protein